MPWYSKNNSLTDKFSDLNKVHVKLVYLQLPVLSVASVVSVNRKVVLQMYTRMAHFPIVTFFPFLEICNICTSIPMVAGKRSMT